MALALAELGYRGDWVEVNTELPGKQSFDVDGKKLLRALEDDLAGRRPDQYVVDDEAEMRARYAQEERDFAQAEALVGVLEGGRGAELFDKAVEGRQQMQSSKNYPTSQRQRGQERRDLDTLITQGQLDRESEAEASCLLNQGHESRASKFRRRRAKAGRSSTT